MLTSFKISLVPAVDCRQLIEILVRKKFHLDEPNTPVGEASAVSLASPAVAPESFYSSSPDRRSRQRLAVSAAR
jgi:hypothetical protein